MTTFSQMVDDIVKETRRADLLLDVARYLNQAIREVQMDPQTNNAILFRDNFEEIQLTATTESGYTWDIPTPERFQGIALVKYLGVWVDGENPFIPEAKPSRALAQQKLFWYRGGTRIAFAGYGGINKSIQIGWFQYPRNLKYKTPAQRQVIWDDEIGYTYPGAITDPDLQAAARELETNWILERWSSVLEEGLRAKVYKRISDDSRARTCYSLYAQLRQGLVTAESYSESWQ